EPGELEDLPGGGEATVGGLDVDRSGVVDGGGHLARHEAVPDEGVEGELLTIEVSGDPLRIVLHRRGPDGLVGVLRVLLRAIHVGRFGGLMGAVPARVVVRGGGGGSPGAGGEAVRHVGTSPTGAPAPGP